MTQLQLGTYIYTSSIHLFISYIGISIWNIFRKHKRTIRLTIKIRERGSNWMQYMELMFLQHIWLENKFRWRFNCSSLPDIEETVKPTNDALYAAHFQFSWCLCWGCRLCGTPYHLETVQSNLFPSSGMSVCDNWEMIAIQCSTW